MSSHVCSSHRACRAGSGSRIKSHRRAPEPCREIQESGQYAERSGAPPVRGRQRDAVRLHFQITAMTMPRPAHPAGRHPFSIFFLQPDTLCREREPPAGVVAGAGGQGSASVPRSDRAHFCVCVCYVRNTSVWLRSPSTSGRRRSLRLPFGLAVTGVRPSPLSLAKPPP